MAFINRITAWSYSRYTDHKQCPYRAKLHHIDKRKEPESAPLLNGSRVHKLAEDWTNKKLGRIIPQELKKFKTEFAALRKQTTVQCEQEWAFDSDWNKVSWFAREAWLRIKMDVCYPTDNTVVVIDHKTGRMHDEHAEQRSLYALGAMLVFPQAKSVLVEHWYLDIPDKRNDVFTADQFPILQKTWLERSAPMLADTRFAPNPGSHCRWCYFRKSNGGPCQF